jgi:hypothetical protein
MSFQSDLAALYRRDLIKLGIQVRAFPTDDLLWAVHPPGVANSAGNLALHLEGNLREYIGRQLGGVAYVRTRPREFADRGLPIGEIGARVDALASLVPGIVASLPDAALETPYPEDVLGEPMSTGYFVAHLQGHLNYHLGQIDYLRRVLTGSGPLEYPRI